MPSNSFVNKIDPNSAYRFDKRYTYSISPLKNISTDITTPQFETIPHSGVRSNVDINFPPIISY